MGSIRRAHSHPLAGKFTAVLKVTGEPGPAVACWLATTTPLHTNSRVPVRLVCAVHVTVTGTLPAALNWISSPGVAMPLTTKLTNSLRPLRVTIVRPKAMAWIQLLYVNCPPATWE